MWQKRRNVLKDGFERLRAILPRTNQKCSKQVILDRGEVTGRVALTTAVGTIDALKTAQAVMREEQQNLLAQIRRLTEENLELRRYVSRSAPLTTAPTTSSSTRTSPARASGARTATARRPATAAEAARTTARARRARCLDPQPHTDGPHVTTRSKHDCHHDPLPQAAPWGDHHPTLRRHCPSRHPTTSPVPMTSPLPPQFAPPSTPPPRTTPALHSPPNVGLLRCLHSYLSHSNNVPMNALEFLAGRLVRIRQRPDH
jgi:hypothetical protein